VSSEWGLAAHEALPGLRTSTPAARAAPTRWPTDEGHVRRRVAVPVSTRLTTDRLSFAGPSYRLDERPGVKTLLLAARHSLDEAATTSLPSQRYAIAHLAALRSAAAMLAARAKPASLRDQGSGIPSGRGRQRPRNAWVLLIDVAPEMGEWAAFFAAGAAKRAAAEAGINGAVSPREADDLVRDSETFLALVETTIGIAHQPPLSAERAPGVARAS
jgi:hypothetical protein